mmetsp:Transcript_425/g.834  ORF Transcript_425/g.834 Transcript_425/m.834 type:complete len:244 (-) Transcript_425:1007-1738(-)
MLPKENETIMSAAIHRLAGTNAPKTPTIMEVPTIITMATTAIIDSDGSCPNHPNSNSKPPAAVPAMDLPPLPPPVTIPPYPLPYREVSSPTPKRASCKPNWLDKSLGRRRYSAWMKLSCSMMDWEVRSRRCRIIDGVRVGISNIMNRGRVTEETTTTTATTTTTETTTKKEEIINPNNHTYNHRPIRTPFSRESFNIANVPNTFGESFSQCIPICNLPDCCHRWICHITCGGGMWRRFVRGLW